MGAMPLPRYTLLHRDAIMTPGKLATLRNYVLSVSIAALSNNEAADTQYRQWIAEGSKNVSGPGSAKRD